LTVGETSCGTVIGGETVEACSIVGIQHYRDPVLGGNIDHIVHSLEIRWIRGVDIAGGRLDTAVADWQDSIVGAAVCSSVNVRGDKDIDPGSVNTVSCPTRKILRGLSFGKIPNERLG